MPESANANASTSQGDPERSAQEYLSRAAAACSQGDAVLGMHLYLTAFEEAARAAGDKNGASDPAVVEGLKEAWSLACELKERSLAEYIFEKLEPYLSSEEAEENAERLQRLELDKLEEFGLSSDDLREMTEAVAQEFRGQGGVNGVMMKFSKPAGSHTSTVSPENAPELAMAFESLDFATAVGFSNAIKTMRQMGVGMEKDPAYVELINMLNLRHGLSRPPAPETLLFRAPVREDAERLMTITMGELGLPALRMRMEEGIAGVPMLCVMAQNDNQPQLNAQHNAFDGPAVLVIEDIDRWGAPQQEEEDSLAGYMLARLSRGARDAISLIESAVESPEVHVLASCTAGTEIDPFFCDLLEPFTIVDIDYPTPSERLEIWMDIAHRYPSLRSVDRSTLVRLSEGLPRYDIYAAAREAVEEAYRISLEERRYVPVSPEMLFEKLAAFLPLDSKEYLALEKAVLANFRRELDDELDDLLKGAGE